MYVFMFSFTLRHYKNTTVETVYFIVKTRENPEKLKKAIQGKTSEEESVDQGLGFFPNQTQSAEFQIRYHSNCVRNKKVRLERDNASNAIKHRPGHSAGITKLQSQIAAHQFMRQELMTYCHTRASTSPEDSPRSEKAADISFYDFGSINQCLGSK